VPFELLHITINRIPTTIGIKTIPKYFSCVDGSEQQNNKPEQAEKWRAKLPKTEAMRE
jgi:hypothetical protein